MLFSTLQIVALQTGFKFLKSILWLSIFLGPLGAFAAMSISGPTTVCPGQTYTYTVNNAGPGESLYFLEENGQPVTIANNRLGSGTTFTIQFNGSAGSAKVIVKTYFPNTDVGFVNETASLDILKRIPIPNKPAGPDGYLILGCSANEQISISSLPGLGNNPNDCYFHCPVLWTAPNGWTLDNQANATGNPIYGAFGNMKLIAPSTNSTGYVGQLSVAAIYSLCGQQQNTANSSTVWFGTPNVRDPQVNGQAAQSFNVVGGSAYLTIQSDAASSYTWSIVGGSGYIYPSYNSCNVSVNGFVRVEARANNRCGNGSSYTFYLSSNSMGGYAVSPNPSREQMTVNFDDEELLTNSVTSVHLLDEKGNIVKNFDVEKIKSAKSSQKNKAIDLDVRSLPRGTYFLHVSYEKQVFKSQVILN